MRMSMRRVFIMYNVDFREKLLEKAAEAAKNAYCPYSHYHVGAALLAYDGEIFTGCNVENSSFGATVCAERTAFVKGISEGCRNFTAIAIAAYSDRLSEDFPFPCGLCRQTMTEFCDESFAVIVTNPKGVTKEYTLGELMPFAFDKKIF